MKISIIHFHPIELYPPILNLLDYLTTDDAFEIEVLTTSNDKNWLSDYSNSRISVNRIKFNSGSLFRRVISYFKFYLYGLFYLIKLRPNTIIYYETYSSISPILYKKVLSRNVKLLCHYHELVLENEYSGMAKIIRIFEKWNVNLLNWISHTNDDRMKIFLSGNNLERNEQIHHVIPNYPPKKWNDYFRPLINEQSQIKLVYIGAIGNNTMYLNEICEFVRTNSNFTIDFYSNNIDNDSKNFFKDVNFCHRITLHNGVNYYDVPIVLKEYHIGIVMYKPFSVNTVQAVSNKLFEYLACGLDVICSDDMVHTFHYERTNLRPFVKLIDFQNLPQTLPKAIENMCELAYAPVSYFCENEYQKIAQYIKN